VSVCSISKIECGVKVLPDLTHYHGTFLEGMKKITKPSVIGRSCCRGLNCETSECEEGMLLLFRLYIYIHVGFVVDEVSLRLVSLRVLPFFPVSIILQTVCNLATDKVFRYETIF
jgi:hypothetical protein